VPGRLRFAGQIGGSGVGTGLVGGGSGVGCGRGEDGGRGSGFGSGGWGKGIGQCIAGQPVNGRAGEPVNETREPADCRSHAPKFTGSPVRRLTGCSYCGVISTKHSLLLLAPEALVSVRRPSVTVTVVVPSIQRVAEDGVPLTVRTPSAATR